LRTIVTDYAPLEDAKIIQDDDKYLIVKAVIASEIVHQYSDGWAYKPADELEKAMWTASGVPIRALAHPRGSHIDDVEDVNGRVENPVFRKDLIDPKTKRPCRRGIETDLKFFRANAPEVTAGPFKPISDATVESIRKGELRDNSIGFSCNKDYTSGTWQGQHYDFVQRKILINHLAAPIPKGRCPAPYCGIAVDSVDEQDMWEVNEESIRSGHKSSDDYEGIKTVEITDGIKALVGCPKGKMEGDKCSVGMETISFIFDKSKFSMEEAKAWFSKHQSKDSAELEAYFKCPVCQKLDEIGVLEVGKRLIIAYGTDVMNVIEGKDQPPKTDVERAKQHFGLSDEEWNALSDEEKKALIAKLPPLGTGRTDTEDVIDRYRRAVEKLRKYDNIME